MLFMTAFWVLAIVGLVFLVKWLIQTTRSKAYRELGHNELADADFKKASKLDPDYYMYSMLTSTELLAEWAGESSRLKSVGWMGVALIVALVFVVIF